MSIKLIAIDIDGTLVDDQKQLDTATSSLLSDLADKGVRVVLCTGRPYLGAQVYLEQMGFHKDSEQYVITHNGALISKTDSSFVKALPLDRNLVKKIMTYCLEKGLRFHLSTHEHMYTPNDPISPYTVNESHHTNMPLRPFMDIATVEHLDVFDVMIADDSHLLDKNEEAIRERFGKYCEIVRSEPHFIEFMHPHAGKGRALDCLTQSLGIPSHEVMSIGNAQNDVSMLEFAGISVAVENAVPEVKAVSDFVTSSNNEQGVKRAIEYMKEHFKQ
ncbi:Cof-type HAD-IIB family hydrolase [Streptococcus hyointestinalis]|nr:Cof-type HAD-IIB family hydrolase [Streptococcus hyointestinalis]